MKLDIGAGRWPKDGFESVDLVPPADHVGDFTEMTFTGVTDVEMSHILEHVSFHLTRHVLEHVRWWMATGGCLRVEVPDCHELCMIGADSPVWNQWMFGSQGGPGQVHMAGFTATTLPQVLETAGWRVTGVRRFISDHPDRVGYPCVEATACV